MDSNIYILTDPSKSDYIETHFDPRGEWQQAKDTSKVRLVRQNFRLRHAGDVLGQPVPALEVRDDESDDVSSVTAGDGSEVR